MIEIEKQRKIGNLLASLFRIYKGGIPTPDVRDLECEKNVGSHLLALAPGCFLRRYPILTETHNDILARPVNMYNALASTVNEEKGERVSLTLPD